jgi:hypothetical protein
MNRLAAVVIAVLVGLLFCSDVVEAQSGQREWVLTSPEDSFGVILTVARCGDILFLGDTQQKIHRYNFGTQKFLTTLGGNQVAFPTSFTADCAGRVLNVVTGIPLKKGATASVQTFGMDSGELRREYSLPRYLPRPGTVLESPDSLLISGLWVPLDRSPEDLLQQSADRYYESLSLGLKLSLNTGETAPMLVPYQRGCIGGGQCPDVRTNGHGTVRIASLPTSTSIGIYEKGTSSTRIIPIRSPQFVRSGETLPIAVSADTRMRWLGRNSTIREVYAFSSGFAVIHARPTISVDFHLDNLSRTRST